ncbi:choline transporter-like protein 1 isoform X2 [Zophobas morio]
MASPTKPIVVEKISTFRRSQVPLEVCTLPEIPQKRKSTDAAFLVSFGICVVVLLSLMIYALCNSNMDRFIHGYDKCGNVCGSKNEKVDDIYCSGQDMSNKPFLTYERTMIYDSYYGLYEYVYTPNICVDKCNSSYETRFHRCFPEGGDIEFFPDMVDAVQKESDSLAGLCLIGLGLSIVALLLFRYFVKQFVWTMLIGIILLWFAITGGIWYLYSDATGEASSSLLYVGIIFTIVGIVFALCILVLIARIKLVIFFFEEAARIVFAMPLLLLEPALTFLSNFLVMAIFVYTFLLMATSGSLQKDPLNYDRYEYILNGATIFVLCWSVIMMIWTLLFNLACQQMVISGAVATYYFARDKVIVVSPIYNSFYNLIRYHLGTVAFGSLLITIITVLKTIIRGLASQNGCLRLLYICFKPLEDLLKYMTSMGYIETAIHGQPLCRSSIRAINLIISNLLSAIAMNSIGNFVFFMAKLVVVVITVVIGILMNLSVVTIVFGGLVAWICVHSFFVVFEIAVDTIFLCYCEDQCLNDGNVNAYYTTIELHNQIKKAQALTLALENAKQK